MSIYSIPEPPIDPPKLKIVNICRICGEGICSGEGIYLIDGDAIHDDCLNDWANKLYNMDCMVGMNQFPDKYFELAIVDPPYGIGRDEGTGSYSKRVVKTIGRKRWDTTPSSVYFAELFRISENQIIWGGNCFNLPVSRGWVCWYKTDGIKGRSFSEFELAWTSFDCVARHYAYKPFIGNGERFHPTQKPIALYTWLLNNYAKQGYKILDTHAGSASSIIACIEAGYDYIGFEADPDYHRMATGRINAYAAQCSMFRAEMSEAAL